jgi:hypothetical protein
MPADVLRMFRGLVANRARDNNLMRTSMLGAPIACIIRSPFAKDRIQGIGKADLILFWREGFPIRICVTWLTRSDVSMTIIFHAQAGS